MINTLDDFFFLKRLGQDKGYRDVHINSIMDLNPTTNDKSNIKESQPPISTISSSMVNSENY